MLKDFIDLSILKDAQPGFSSQSVLIDVLSAVKLCDVRCAHLSTVTSCIFLLTGVKIGGHILSIMNS